MTRLILILGFVVGSACGPQAGPGDDAVAADTGTGGDDDGGRDDDGGSGPASASGAAVTTDLPDPASTGAVPETTTGIDATTGDTGGAETGRVACEDQPTIQACRDAGCMVTVGRRWNFPDEGGVCIGPEELVDCLFPIACFMPEFACPMFAAPYVLEIIEGCLPELHQECDAPAVAAPECP